MITLIPRTFHDHNIAMIGIMSEKKIGGKFLDPLTIRYQVLINLAPLSTRHPMEPKSWRYIHTSGDTLNLK